MKDHGAGMGASHPRGRAITWEREMITNATNASHSGPETAKASINSSKDAPNPATRRGAGKAEGWAPDWSGEANRTVYTSHTESLYMKYTSSDGDVLELRAESSEESYSSETVRFSATARALAAGHGGPDAKRGEGAVKADGNPAGETAAAEADPKAKQLAELREWAKQVERELRQQQHKLLERILKQSGRHVDSGDGKFLVFSVPPADREGAAAKDGAAEDEADVPPYWNAENTSDRIVHFATQMAEISGLDPKEFAEKIKDAIGKGFDQAGEVTGALTGAAGKLNRDTRELVFAKLSKWLEARESVEYNQGGPNQNKPTAEVPYGIENHKQ
jgi:hypothetical protein